MSRQPTRPLRLIEAAMAVADERWPLNMVTVLHLDAVPDVDRLREALDALQADHPPLRVRRDLRGRHHLFVQDAAPRLPLTVVDARQGDAWRGAVEDHLNTPMPNAGPLAAVTLVRSSGRAQLIMAFQHDIVDGVSAANLLGELLTTYAEPGRRAHPDEPGPPLDELVPERYRGWRLLGPTLRHVLRSAVDEMRFRWSTRGRMPRVDADSRTCIDTRTLDAPTTARLVAATRAHHCTVHSLLHAVVLTAVARHRYPAKRLHLRTIAFANLRPHLARALPARRLAPVITLTSQDVPIAPDDDLWAVAGRVQERLRASVRGAAKFVSFRMSEPLMRAAVRTGRLRMATTAVSHTGPISINGADGPLPVEHLHAFVSNLAVGPELSLRTGMFRGRLTLDLMTLDTAMTRTELARLADAIVDQLLAIGHSDEAGADPLGVSRRR